MNKRKAPLMCDMKNAKKNKEEDGTTNNENHTSFSGDAEQVDLDDGKCTVCGEKDDEERVCDKCFVPICEGCIEYWNPEPCEDDRGFLQPDYTHISGTCKKCHDESICNSCNYTFDDLADCMSEECNNHFCHGCYEKQMCPSCDKCIVCTNLNEEHLDDGWCQECWNHVQHLFLPHLDVVHLSRLVLKYSGISSSAQLHEKEEKIKMKKQASEARRKALLVTALERKGLEFRSDSRLCQRFIEQGPNHVSLKHCVTEMQTMNFLFKHTTYSHDFEKEMNAARRYKGYYNQMECSDSARSTALTKYWTRKQDRSCAPSPVLKIFDEWDQTDQ